MRNPLRGFCFVLPTLEEEEPESERGFVERLGNVAVFFGAEGWEVGLVGTLWERASGDPFFGKLGLDHRVRPNPQLVVGESLFFEDGRNILTETVDTAREWVGVGLLSREGVGVSEFEESMEGGGEGFLKGKGRRDKDFGFDQWRDGEMEWWASICWVVGFEYNGEGGRSESLGVHEDNEESSKVNSISSLGRCRSGSGANRIRRFKDWLRLDIEDADDEG
jgi:hypothetical protein